MFLIVFTIIILAVISIRTPLVYYLYTYLSFLRKRLSNRFYKIKTYDDLNEMLKLYGYSYDVEQDIFISNYDAWQRQMGYCRLFDEAAATVSMILDCEPICFEYDKKMWMIEFWKGQYGVATGFEIGIYYSEWPDITIDDNILKWYESVRDEDMLNMSFTLMKKGRILMKREAKHWWISGFILGEFSQPEELTAYLNITLKDSTMRDSFLSGLEKAGYNNIIVNENTVSIKFDKPKTPQPYTRIKEFEEYVQFKNKLLCDEYNELTQEFDNILDKLAAVQRLDPILYDKLLLMGKAKPIFSEYENIKASLEWKVQG